MTTMPIGERLREARSARNWSLRALGELTGFSASFLSQVERGQTSPSLGSLERIATALGSTMAKLLTSEDDTNTVVRRSSRTQIRSEWSKASVESLARPKSDDDLQAIVIRVDPKGHTGYTACGLRRRIFVYCTAGALEASLTNPDEAVRLAEGDSIIIDGPRTVAWKNEDMEFAEIIVVTVRMI